MLVNQGSICHGQLIHAIIKLNIGVQLYSVGINIIVEHILSGMWIISKEDSLGEIFFDLYFLFPEGCTETQHPNFQREERFSHLDVAFSIG